MSEIHVTKEVMKAETALKRIRRNTEKAIDKVTLAWMQREADYIDKLPEEVKRGLRACGVIGTQAPKFDESFTLDPADVEENPAFVPSFSEPPVFAEKPADFEANLSDEQKSGVWLDGGQVLS